MVRQSLGLLRLIGGVSLVVFVGSLRRRSLELFQLIGGISLLFRSLLWRRPRLTHFGSS
jgi:hypothetical protein